MAAFRLAPGSAEYWMEHLTICSPCFVEYSSYVRQAKLRRHARFALIAATVIVTLGVAIWIAMGGFGGPSMRHGPEVAQHTTPPLQPITFDLRSLSTSRGEGRPGVRQPTLVAPRSRLRITLLLPIGSEESDYEVRLIDSEGRQTFSGQEHARILDYVTTLRVDADLRGVAPGNYTLQVGRPGFSSQAYAVTVE
jgi:hypothetical protein